MAKEWNRCSHCEGRTRCDCGDCRVFWGQGMTDMHLAYVGYAKVKEGGM